MSQKTDLQSNNIDLQSILNTINNLPDAGSGGTNSGSEDLDTELTEQENLISQLSSILDSKASGGGAGGSIETCTVTISCEGYIRYVVFSLESNGAVTTGMRGNWQGDLGGEVTLENVVCGSAITMQISANYEVMGYYAPDSVSIIHHSGGLYVFNVPRTANAHHYLSFYDAD